MPTKFTLYYLTALLCILLGKSAIAQQVNLRPIAASIETAKLNNIPFIQSKVFEFSADVQYRVSADQFVQNATFAKLKIATIGELYQTKNDAIDLEIPYGENEFIQLELVKVNLFAEGFSVRNSNNPNEIVPYSAGVYYHGTIKGDPNSIAAISIFEDELIGTISTDLDGNINIGRYRKGEVDDYMIFSDRDILVENDNAGCATEDDESYQAQFQELLNTPSGSRITSCPKVYLEADFQLYSNKGTVTNTANYLTAIFNNSAIIYANEFVPIEISEIFVWTSADGYSSTSSFAALTSFKSFRTTFNGDIAHLCALDAGGLGGVASTINGLCSSTNKYCYSDIDASYSDFPTYSWTVMVFTHEMGHLFGSYHTHNCGWTGGAIDNCYTTEGGCSSGPAPSGGGTIMSYCHLTSYGINFNNGFGTQPGNAIRNTISAASCVTSCGGTATTYCASEGSSTVDEWMQSATIGATTNNSGNNSGYADFTSTTINLTEGVSTSLSLSPGYTSTIYTEYFSIWIDYNNDFDFTDAGENVYNSGGTTTTVTGSFTVPTGIIGTKRMRISMKYNALASSCEVFEYGEVEDYTVSIAAAGASYCSANGISSSTEWIDLVTLADLSRTSLSDAGYYNGTSLIANVAQGSNYTILYSAGFASTLKKEFWKVWIDYNQDGDFIDAGEQIVSKSIKSSATLSKSFTIPATATAGNTRMRIAMKFGSFPTSCETFSNGEVEDYTIAIAPSLPFSPLLNAPFSIAVLPNPNNGLFFIEWQNVKEDVILIDIIDVTGKIITTQNALSNQQNSSIDISNWADGIYFARVYSSSGEVVISQLIKQ